MVDWNRDLHYPALFPSSTGWMGLAVSDLASIHHAGTVITIHTVGISVIATSRHEECFKKSGVSAQNVDGKSVKNRVKNPVQILSRIKPALHPHPRPTQKNNAEDCEIFVI